MTVAPSMTAIPTSAAASASPTVSFASDNPNGVLWSPDSNVVLEPMRGSLGRAHLQPSGVPVALQNGDSDV